MPEADVRQGTNIRRLKATLLVVSFLFEVADAVTTNIILGHGLGELNPFMALAQTWFGGWWLVPKLGLALVVVWLMSLSKNPRHMAYVMILLAIPVYNNLIIIAGLE